MATLSSPKQPTQSLAAFPPNPPKISSIQKNIQKIMGDYQYSFMLIKNNTLCFYENIVADFAPRSPEQRSKTSLYEDLLAIRSFKNKQFGVKDSDLQKTYPIYNRDSRYFTPAFIVGEDAIYYEETPFLQYDKFQEKKRQANKQCQFASAKKKKVKNQQIYVPKPRKTYCHVCKKEYDDYLTHINSTKHRNRVNKNQYNTYIHELANTYNRKRTINSQSQDTEINASAKNQSSIKKTKKIMKKSKNI